MLTDNQINDMMKTYLTSTAKVQKTESKILIWDDKFVFEANKLGNFWYVKLQ